MVFVCSTCNVSLNSQSQLSQHQIGSKHLKKLKALGISGAAVANAGPTTATGKKGYGNFVSSAVLMPLKAELVTPPKTSTSLANDEAPPPPPPQQTPQQTTPKQTTLQQATPQNISIVTTPREGIPPPPPPPPPTPPQRKQPKGVNPVVQAIVDNALGKLPLKRKAYDGQCEICKVNYTSESHEKQHLMGSKHAKKAKIASAAAGNVPLAAFTGFNCTYCNVVLNSLEQLSAHREGLKHKNTVKKLQQVGKIQEECKDVTVIKV